MIVVLVLVLVVFLVQVVVLVVEEEHFMVQRLVDQRCVDQCQTALGQLLMLLRLLVVWDVWFWVF